MEVKAVVLALIILLICGCVGYYPMDEAHKRHYEEKKEYYEDQREEYERRYEEEEKRERGDLLIVNATSDAVYLVIDYRRKFKMRPGKRVTKTLAKGFHVLEAYDAEGCLVDRTRRYIDSDERSVWLIGR
jgi:hypothetical protein